MKVVKDCNEMMKQIQKFSGIKEKNNGRIKMINKKIRNFEEISKQKEDNLGRKRQKRDAELQQNQRLIEKIKRENRLQERREELRSFREANASSVKKESQKYQDLIIA